MKIYSDNIPTYIFNFTNERKYQRFKELLTENFKNHYNINPRNKIRYDDISLVVSVYYYPFIFRGFITELFISDCLQEGLLTNLRSNSHTDILHSHLNLEYIAQHNLLFSQAVKDFDGLNIKPKDFSTAIKKLSIKNSMGTYKDYNQFISELFTTSYGIGEKHTDYTPHKFLMDNIPLLDPSFKLIFLEGIPYEAQYLLDEFYKSNKKRVSGELACVLLSMELGQFSYGQTIEIVECAKAHGKRVVGLETQRTCLLASSDKIKNSGYLYDRVKAFNYEALIIIQSELNKPEYQGCNFVFKVGLDHLVASRGKLPGLARLLNVPGIAILDGPSSIDDDAYYLLAADADSQLKEEALGKNSYIDFDFLISTNADANLTINRVNKENNNNADITGPTISSMASISLVTNLSTFSPIFSKEKKQNLISENSKEGVQNTVEERPDASLKNLII